MSTNVNYDNINSLLVGIVQNLKPKIAAIDLTQTQKDMLVKLDKIIKTGTGTSFLSDNGSYKNIPIDQIQNMLDKLTTIYSLFGITNVTEHWDSTGILNMPTARYYLTSQIYNGKIYCIGGYGSGVLNKVEIYDIASNTWTTGTNMTTARYELTSAIYNGKIYCIGGYNAGVLNKVEIYDIASNTWTTGANIPINMQQLTSVIYNGKIYCIGGSTNNINSTNALEIYDITSNSWSTGTVMPTSRYDSTSNIYNGKIYCIGGYNSSYLNTLEIYDIASNTWTTGANMTTARMELTSVIYNGKIYCIGGVTFSSVCLNTVEIYDIASNIWTTGASMPTVRQQLTSQIYNYKIYCIGGEKLSSYSSLEVLWLANTSYSISTPTDITTKLATLVNNGLGTKLLTDNGTYQEYIATGYRELTTTELNALINKIKINF